MKLIFLINNLTCLIFCSNHHVSLLNIEGSSLTVYAAILAPPAMLATLPQVVFSELLDGWINSFLFIANSSAFGEEKNLCEIPKCHEDG